MAQTPATPVMDHTYDCKHAVEIEQEPRHHLVFSNEFVRGFAVEIAPHDRTRGRITKLVR